MTEPPMMYDLYAGRYILAREAGAYIPRDLWEREGVLPRPPERVHRGFDEMSIYDDLLERHPHIAEEIREGDGDIWSVLEEYGIEPQAR